MPRENKREVDTSLIFPQNQTRNMEAIPNFSNFFIYS